MINAEKAAFQAKVFIEKRKRTVDALLKDMYIDHLKEVNKVWLFISTFWLFFFTKYGFKNYRPILSLKNFCRFSKILHFSIEKMQSTYLLNKCLPMLVKYALRNSFFLATLKVFGCTFKNYLIPTLPESTSHRKSLLGLGFFLKNSYSFILFLERFQGIIF